MKKHKQKDSTALFLLLQKYARPFWKHIVLLVFITLLANIFTTLQPVVVSGVVDAILKERSAVSEFSVIKAQPAVAGQQAGAKLFDLNQLGARTNKVLSSLSPNGNLGIWPSLGVMSLLFLMLSLLAAGLNYLALVFSRWICVGSARLIRQDISRHLLSLGLGFFHQQKSGELISRFTQDVKNTALGLGPLVRSLIHHSVLIIIYSVYLFSTSAWLSLGAIGMILMQFGLTKIIKQPVRRTTREIFDKMADFTSTLQEMFTSIRVIKSFSAEGYELTKLQKDIDSVSKSEFREGLVKNIEPNAREFLDSFAIIGIFLIATIQLMRGSLTIQGFLLFIYVGKLLVTPINLFAVNFVWIQALLASHERLDELFAEKPQVIDGSISKENFQDRIELKKVLFAYGHQDVLKDVTFQIKKGEILALVGPSGAGKSTLTDLILRFYDPKEGEIFIDGINLRELKVSAYRKIFGVVPQESLLFNDTVENNIRYGRGELSEEEIIDAAKIANAHDFILELPGGYATFVGDRGVRLSGGQRQRIAIARAIVAKPEILIFDEATSSLDTESEKQVQAAVDRVLENRTAIIIAHRLSTILHANKILVLNKGMITDIGSHSKLLDSSAVYKRLYQLQFETRGSLV